MPEPIKILIVDDDEDVLIALERTLEGEGYRTATAWSGREALQLAETGRFDVLLVDEHLCDVEAATLCAELLRRQPAAVRFLMYARKDKPVNPLAVVDMNVCKWEHSEVTARIRRHLAA